MCDFGAVAAFDDGRTGVYDGVAMRMGWLGWPLTAVIVATASPTAQGPSVPPALEQARAALGGATLEAVSSFAVTGFARRDRNAPGISGTVEFDCVLPDQFVRITHDVEATGRGSLERLDYLGFNKLAPIGRTDTPEAASGVSPITPMVSRRSATDLAAAKAKLLLAQQHVFAEFTLPLFAASFDGYGMAFSSAGQARLASGTADEVDATGLDGFVIRIFLDAGTHLPILLSWKDPPASNGRPTRDLAPIEWQLALGDYQVSDGLHWPRHFVTTFGSHALEDLRLSRVEINPKIDPNRFRPMR